MSAVDNRDRQIEARLRAVFDEPAPAPAAVGRSGRGLTRRAQAEQKRARAILDRAVANKD